LQSQDGARVVEVVSAEANRGKENEKRDGANSGSGASDREYQRKKNDVAVVE